MEIPALNRLPLGDQPQKEGWRKVFKGKGARGESPVSAMSGFAEQPAGWRLLQSEQSERSLGLSTPPSLEASPAFCSTKHK